MPSLISDKTFKNKLMKRAVVKKPIHWLHRPSIVKELKSARSVIMHHSKSAPTETRLLAMDYLLKMSLAMNQRGLLQSRICTRALTKLRKAVSALKDIVTFMKCK